ncbi:MAG: beta-galactosidase [Candidatus Zixiibacteriota bacterium]
MHAANMLVWSYSLCSLLATQAAAEQILFDFKQNFDVRAVEAQDAKVSLSESGAVLRLATGHNIQWPGITLKAPQGQWDLSTYAYLALDVENVGSNHVGVFCRIDNPGADGIKNCVTKSIELEPGEKKTLKVFLQRSLPASLSSKLFGMRGYPGGLSKEKGIDASIINQLIVFVNNPTADHVFEISDIRAGGSYVPPKWLSMDENEFFPLIDEYGQFIHKDWPNKTKSIKDLAKRKEEEDIDLAKHPGTKDWNSYGGWKAGPQLTATGYFRVEKHKGKWWLVDPDGRLFWSHGIDCVRSGNGVTPITDRKYLFQDLPDESSPLARFYGKGSWGPHNYYEGKNYEIYNFTGANLFRKYGRDWKRQFAEMAHRRLRSWGMNTIANWSDEDIYLMRKTPYVATIHFGGRELEGSEGYWGKFRDVFDPSFKAELRDSLARQKGRSAGDPWCIGYFVDNELAWGHDVSLAVAALISPPDQPAKKVFVEDMKAKYETIENLNQAWGTQHASWDALLQSRQAPDEKKAYADLAGFYTKTAEMYFKTCRDAVKEIAPNNLYLGCRFAWVNQRAVEAAAKYCDVISYNFYRREVESFRPPRGIDKPVTVGEFHFGALDRGMFHTGLQKTESQNERAEAYKNYVSGAMQNPWIVGTHWFQYGDQATTGRGDGENYQIGFLDVVDTPYAETIQACREVGYSMYELRGLLVD